MITTIHNKSVTLLKDGYNISQQASLYARRQYCGRRRNKRYDSTGLLTVTYQLIYRNCTGLLEYTQLV